MIRNRNNSSCSHIPSTKVSLCTSDESDPAAREIKRKQYASELFHLTTAEIAEEEALYIEIKRMEQNEMRYKADRDDLMRTVMGLDSGLIKLDQANSEGVLGLDKVGRVSTQC